MPPLYTSGSLASDAGGCGASPSQNSRDEEIHASGPVNASQQIHLGFRSQNPNLLSSTDIADST